MRAIVCLLFIVAAHAEDKPAKPTVLDLYKMRVGDAGKMPDGTYITRAVATPNDCLVEYTTKGSTRKVTFLCETFDTQLEADDTDNVTLSRPNPNIWEVVETRKFWGKTYFWVSVKRKR